MTFYFVINVTKKLKLKLVCIYTSFLESIEQYLYKASC